MNLNNFLQEQSTTVGSMGGEMDSHFGRGRRKGLEVDDIFAGGYVATDSIKGDLTRQITSRKEKRKAMEDMVGNDGVGLENPIGGHYDIFTDQLIQTYDLMNQDIEDDIEFNKKVTPESQFKWEILPLGDYYKFDGVDDTKTDFEHKYDETGIDNSDEFNKTYKNDTNHYKSLGDFL